MKQLQAKFSENAEEELEQLMKSTKETRLFRRAQALLAIVKGKPVSKAALLYSYADSNLRIWVRRYEKGGIEGLKDKSKPGRDKKFTPEIEAFVLQLLDEDPLKYKGKYPFWVCSELARVLKQKKGLDLSDESIRLFLKKKNITTTYPKKK